MAYHKYRKKTKRERQRKRKIFILLSCLLIAAAAIFCVLYFWYRQKQYRISSGYEDTSVASRQEEGQITYQGKSYVPNDHLSNYLFLGIDSSTSLSESSAASPGRGGQADAIYLISYDRAEKTRQTFAIPRDTMTEIETFSPDGNSLGFAKSHLTLQYSYGDGGRKSCELMEEAVSKLFYGQKIAGYAAISVDSISHLTELVGYVDVTVPDNSLVSVNAAYTEGATVRLTPENTETFVRYRDTKVSQSAISRMNRQIAFISAFASRVRELQSQDASTVTSIYNGLQDYLITNMGSDVFLDLEEAESRGSIETIPGEGTSGDVYDEYIVDDDQLYDLIVKNFYKEVQTESDE